MGEGSERPSAMTTRNRIQTFKEENKVFVIPRIINIKNYDSRRHFRLQKCGQAEIIKILPLNKYLVRYLG
jgi:hypothetical protein